MTHITTMEDTESNRWEIQGSYTEGTAGIPDKNRILTVNILHT
jgi:hypothetical protein